ncbi:MAG: ATPase [Chloroflexi bacterium]|nr:ATPase [Chloroflexota bacterium]
MLGLIDRLEALVNAGTRVPLTSKALIDEQEFLELVDQLRVAVPDEVRQARRVSHDRDRVLSQAQTEADKVLIVAQERVEQMVQQNEIVRLAQKRAEEIVANGQEEARRLRTDAYGYAMDVLDGLENELNRLLATVRKGKSALEKMSEDNDTGEVTAGISSRGGRTDGKDPIGS